MINKWIKLLSEKIAAIVTIITAVSVITQTTIVIENNTKSIDRISVVVDQLKKSIHDVPLKMMMEQNQGVIFNTVNYPTHTSRKDMPKKIQSWFDNSSGIQIQALQFQCKHNRKMLSMDIWPENVHLFCSRFRLYTKAAQEDNIIKMDRLDG